MESAAGISEYKINPPAGGPYMLRKPFSLVFIRLWVGARCHPFRFEMTPRRGDPICCASSFMKIFVRLRVMARVPACRKMKIPRR